MLGAAECVGLSPREQRHRVEAVKNPPGKADRSRELVVQMDRVEVPRRVGVARGDVAVGRDAERRKLGTGLEPGHVRGLTICVQRPWQTSSPRWFVERDSKT